MQSSASRSLHLRFDRRHTARMVTQEEKKQTRIKENIIMFYTCWTVCPLRCFLIVQIKQFILNMMWLQNTVCQKISAVLPAHTYTVQLPSGSIFILQWVINELFFFFTPRNSSDQFNYCSQLQIRSHWSPFSFVLGPQKNGSKSWFDENDAAFWLIST